MKTAHRTFFNNFSPITISEYFVVRLRDRLKIPFPIKDILPTLL